MASSTDVAAGGTSDVGDWMVAGRVVAVVRGFALAVEAVVAIVGGFKVTLAPGEGDKGFGVAVGDSMTPTLSEPVGSTVCRLPPPIPGSTAL